MSTRAAALLTAALSIAIYLGALSCGFAGDDFMILHRLREAGGLTGAARFFRGEFFEYYRPLPFMIHALDWTLAGANATVFHLTNVLLHALNAVLVVLIGRELSPRTAAGPIAGLLFALHPSNHEAVVWISARFDVLATLFSLAAIWWTVRSPDRSTWLAPLLFLCATLSKEAAVALPIAAAAFWTFVRRTTTVAAARRVAPWLGALVVYSALRRIAGGVSSIGGAGRLPKLLAFAIVLGVVLLLGDGRWLRLRGWLRERRGLVIGTLSAVALVGAGVAAADGTIGRIAADKLAVAGFALFHLASPVLDLFAMPFYLDPRTAMYWAGGAMAVLLTLAVLAAAWTPVVDDDRAWFLAAFLVAALLPISALTEGTRYLYLPSAAVSLLIGVLVADLRPRGRTIGTAILTAYLAVSAIAIVMKVRDWQWAGRMVADGARTVDASLAPSCGEGHVVFLTEPVAVRGVYTHFLYETFELPRGCMPAQFENLTRVMRVDTTVNARWDGPSRIVMRIPHYRGNLSLSSDLRNFDPTVPTSAAERRQTPLGEVVARPADDAEEVTLTIAPSVDASRVHWFYYSDGAMRSLVK
jgi:hypothetical protein